jgi:protein-tyrosine phosphatase
LVRQRTDELERELTARHLPLTVLPGGEIRLDERLTRLLDADELLTVADRGSAVLVELPFDVAIDPTDIVQKLANRNIQAVLAHAERYKHLRDDPELVNSLRQSGAFIQVNAASLLGEEGRSAYQASWQWVHGGVADVVASDAHGRMRPPRLGTAARRISEDAGELTAKRLCFVNPVRLAMGRRTHQQVPHPQPEDSRPGLKS